MLSEHLLVGEDFKDLSRSPSFTELSAPLGGEIRKTSFLEGLNAFDLLGAVIGPLLLLPFAVAFVGVVVAAAPELQADFPLCLSTVIFSQTVSTLYYVLFSQFRTCTNIDLLSAACFGKMIAIVKTTVPEADIFVHLVVCQGLFTLLVGVALLLVAFTNGIWYLRFLPYTVSSGFVMGIGFLIADGGFELGAGCGMKELVMGIGSFPVMTFVHAGMTLIAAGLILALSRVVHSSLRLPSGLLLVTLLTHGIAWAVGADSEELAAHGFLLEGLTSEPWTAGWEELAMRFSDVQASTFLQMPLISVIASYLALHILCFPFYAVAVQECDKSASGKQVSLTKEVSMMGVGNVIVGALGGVPVAHSIKVLVVMQDSGGKSKLWSLLVGISFAMLYFSDYRAVLSVIPKCAFGGMVASLGFEFIHISFVESRERIAAAELRFVLITAIVTWFDVLTGLTFGLLVVAFFFIVEYGGMTGINRKTTLANVRSNVDRWKEDVAILDAQGDKVMVFWLTGYIFFGSAVGAVEEMEAEIDGQPSIDHLIIDFENVPAVDASGVHHFTNFAGKCLRREPPISVCFSGTVRRLMIALTNAAHSKGVSGLRLEGDLVEEALSWAEESVLQRQCGSPKSRRSMRIPNDLQDTISIPDALRVFLQSLATQQPLDALEAVATSLIPVAQLTNASKDFEMFVEGEVADQLIFVVRGSVALMRNLRTDDCMKLPEHHLNKEKGDVFVFEERKRVRVQQVRSGAVLGATEFSSGKTSTRWTTSAVVVEDCHFLSVPFADFLLSMQSQPEVGLAATQQLGKIVSSHLVRLLRKSEAMPFTNL